ncbi:hypothetical protein GEZ92_09415 [Streptococcus mitis]|nr:hypothetical protein [Streptococcus mitis]MQQ14590.1 hypothetical protein [Streptococcus mitis]MQQ45323.1 hypothetical protein [Streptococcus mitis]MQQ47234.1 hypothetical protein [Streptococcus mitis]MQQ58694.1 hypothetical protein [Streptococcus mitis]
MPLFPGMGVSVSSLSPKSISFLRIKFPYYSTSFWPIRQPLHTRFSKKSLWIGLGILIERKRQAPSSAYLS